ncbi:MAG: hypothetical protein J6333_08800 [Planctomycetes bacterium]|nr:hypothetical protein [Planctomycetota bacterium]
MTPPSPQLWRDAQTIGGDRPYRTLYRAVGLPEWRLVLAEGRRRFPPETLTGRFYLPHLRFPGACAAARDLLAPSPATEQAGLVVAFNVAPEALDLLGDPQNCETDNAMAGNLWVGATILRELNRRVENSLRVVESFYGPARDGPRYRPQELNESGFLG